MSFHVRDPETDALMRELAENERMGLTEAVKLAVSEKLDRTRDERAAKLAALKAIRDEVASWPRTGLKADKAFFDELSGD